MSNSNSNSNSAARVGRRRREGGDALVRFRLVVYHELVGGMVTYHAETYTQSRKDKVSVIDIYKALSRVLALYSPNDQGRFARQGRFAVITNIKAKDTFHEELGLHVTRSGPHTIKFLGGGVKTFTVRFTSARPGWDWRAARWRRLLV